MRKQDGGSDGSRAPNSILAGGVHGRPRKGGECGAEARGELGDATKSGCVAPTERELDKQQRLADGRMGS